jgi:hypothetical protein
VGGCSGLPGLDELSQAVNRPRVARKIRECLKGTMSAPEWLIHRSVMTAEVILQ